jgi:hypothetical protein
MRTFIEYDPEKFTKVDGVCVGFFIKSQLESERVPGVGPGLPPNTLDVTDREQEGLGFDGWMEFAYDPETDTFTKIDMVNDWPETADGEGGNP